MNRKTLQKVIDAIKAEKIEYAMGILDTLIESLPEEQSTITPVSRSNVMLSAVTLRDEPMIRGTEAIDDEARRLEAEAKAKMGNIDLGSVTMQ